MISKDVQKQVVNIIRKSKYRLQQSAVLDIVEDLRSHEAVTVGKSPNSLDTVSKNPLKRYHEHMGLEIKYAESMTEARAKATTSIRNAMSYHAMTRYASVVLNVRCAKIINSDGSSFTVGATDKECAKVLVLKMEPGEAKCKEDLNQFIAPKGVTLFGV